MSTTKYDYLFKYIIIGDQAVGKSNLLLRFANEEFKEEYQATLGVEFGSKNINVNNKLCRIQIWDTAGQEIYKSITRAYYKNCACALIVYDISNKESFDNVKIWIEDCRNQCPKTVYMILVGNKSDLDAREVTYDEGQEVANSVGIDFFETSAKTGQNVEELFTHTAKDILRNIEKGNYDLSDESCGIKEGFSVEKRSLQPIHSEVEQKKKGCC